MRQDLTEFNIFVPFDFCAFTLIVSLSVFTHTYKRILRIITHLTEIKSLTSEVGGNKKFNPTNL